MRTVPYHLAELAVGDIIAGHGVKVGRSVEIDLDSLAAQDPEAARRAAEYAETAGETPGAYLAVAVPLISVRQRDNASGRADLNAELEALESSELGDVVSALLGRERDDRQATTLGAPYRIESQQIDAVRACYTLTVPGRRPWSMHLGGAPSPREVARRFTISTSHAYWRDRRSRRLLSLEVHSIELVADPHQQ